MYDLKEKYFEFEFWILFLNMKSTPKIKESHHSNKCCPDRY